MLYRILKYLMQLTSSVFFRSITIRNADNIPADAPLMVLSNHPSTFMDPIVIATVLDRPLYFLAKGELFKTKFSRWLFPRLNMIPVYRKQDDPQLMGNNEATFVKCFEHLERSGAILMFPEGISITERKLKPLKTGAARIVLGAEARNNFQLNSKIICIGLNYKNPHKFKQHLYINVHQPITLMDYKDLYGKDPFEAVRQLTEDIRKQLESIIIDIEDERTDELVASIELLYKYTIHKELGNIPGDQDADFEVTKTIVETVRYFKEKDPGRVENIEKQIREYLKELELAGIEDKDLAKHQKKGSILSTGFQVTFLFLLGMPFYLYGLIHNFLPFEIPGWIAKRISKSIEFRGAIGMVGGFFTFLIFYTAFIVLFAWWAHNPLLTILYGLSLPAMGLFCYWYYHTLQKLKAKWVILNMFRNKKASALHLLEKREELIAEFEKATTEIRNESSSS